MSVEEIYRRLHALRSIPARPGDKGERPVGISELDGLAGLPGRTVTHLLTGRRIITPHVQKRLSLALQRLEKNQWEKGRLRDPQPLITRFFQIEVGPNGPKLAAKHENPLAFPERIYPPEPVPGYLRQHHRRAG